MTDQTILSLYKKFLISGLVSTDSRTIKKNSIFFAIRGDNFDGNQFAQDALDKGALYSVIDDNTIESRSDRFILVDNCLKALQDLAITHRDSLGIPVIGLTGSNGKTTTKSLLAECLKSKYVTYSTKGNLNNHIGVPLSVLDIKESCEVAVIEMGASAVGDIKQLCDISKPTIALITNISGAHLKGFKNIEGVIRGKSELFDFILKNGGKVFINNKDKVLKNFTKRFSDPIEVHGDNSYCKIKLLESEPNIIFSDSNDNEYTTNLFGEYNFENIMMAISVSKFLGIDEEISSDIISKYHPEENRSQKFTFSSNCVVLDAYNANPVSMLNAIKSVSKFSHKNKVMILGDMNELGEFMESEHRNIGKITSRLNLDACYFVGSKMKFAHEENKSSFWFEKLSDLEDELAKKKFRDTDILVKGSRSLELENIVELLKKISV